MTLYVYSPVVGPTGGTELLQQFCSIARSLGIDAQMLYQKDPEGSPILQKFGYYENPYTTSFPDRPNDSIIIPEHFADYCHRVKHAKCAIWWLSVDNYWGASYEADGYSYKDVYRITRRLLYRPVHRQNIIRFNSCVHFYQSEYARKYIVDELGLPSANVYPLSDFIDPRYRELDCTISKSNRVLYNPKKGIKYTRQLIELDPTIDWTPLEGYSSEELLELMQKSKVYIDFGAHPGKDRLPREAAACGCCLLTGARGAAGNKIDVPIRDELKIHPFDAHLALTAIHSLLDNYESEHAKLSEYRRSIAIERDVFCSEVKEAASILNGDAS